MGTIGAWACLAIAITLNIFANLFLKQAVMVTGGSKLDVYQSLYFMLGILFFGLNLLAYTQAQSTLAVSIAYPVLVGLSVIGITVGGKFLFGETIKMVHCIGLLIIIIGVAIVAYNEQ